MTCADCTHYAGNGECRKNKTGTTSPLKVADELKCFEQAEPEKPVLPYENKPETKVCKGCGRELPLDAFWRNRQGPTGYCKDCMKEKHAKAAAKREQKYKDNEERILRQVFGEQADSLDEAKKAFDEELDRVAPVKSIKAFTDDELVSELRDRGFAGRIVKTITFDF